MGLCLFMPIYPPNVPKGKEVHLSASTLALGAASPQPYQHTTINTLPNEEAPSHFLQTPWHGHLGWLFLPFINNGRISCCLFHGKRCFPRTGWWILYSKTMSHRTDCSGLVFLEDMSAPTTWLSSNRRE